MMAGRPGLAGDTQRGLSHSGALPVSPGTLWMEVWYLETDMHERNSLERVLEMLLFRSRWLMAPFYLGMVVALVMLLAAFMQELLHALPNLLNTDPEHV